MTADIKTYNFNKAVERYYATGNEAQGKILNKLASEFVGIKNYACDEIRGVLCPVFAVPEGFSVKDEPVMYDDKITINFKRESDGHQICVLVQAAVKKDIPINRKGTIRYSYYSVFEFLVILGSVYSFEIVKEITPEEVIELWENREEENFHNLVEEYTPAELVESYFEAEDEKRVYIERLSGFAEGFIKIENWLPVREKIDHIRICPVLVIPDGYTAIDTTRITEVSKEQEIRFVKTYTDGAIIEKVKVVVNVSGTECIKRSSLGLGDDDSFDESYYFCNSMKFKVIFTGADDQKLRLEYRKTVTKDDMKKILIDMERKLY